MILDIIENIESLIEKRNKMKYTDLYKTEIYYKLSDKVTKEKKSMHSYLHYHRIKNPELYDKVKDIKNAIERCKKLNELVTTRLKEVHDNSIEKRKNYRKQYYKKYMKDYYRNKIKKRNALLNYNVEELMNF